MSEVDRRNFLALVTGSIGLVSAGSALYSLLAEQTYSEIDPDTRWIHCPQSQGVKSYTGEFIKMLAYAPEEVTFNMYECGTVIDEDNEDQKNVLVVFEAKPKECMTQALAESLKAVGFRPFLEFPMDSILAQREQLRAEGRLVDSDEEA
jgi:hypothetical protein